MSASARRILPLALLALVAAAGSRSDAQPNPAGKNAAKPAGAFGLRVFSRLRFPRWASWRGRFARDQPRLGDVEPEER
jgi:hypothetical protein